MDRHERQDRPLLSIDDEDEYIVREANYKGLFHAWECPDCMEYNFEEEDVDPREVGIFVTCKHCGWEGRVEG